MKSTKLNINWNAEPNKPEIQLQLIENCVILEFTLNALPFEHIAAGERGQLMFESVYAYRMQEITQEAYSNGAHRFKNTQLPWGEFYELTDSGWMNHFSDDAIVVDAAVNKKELRHFIFFLHNAMFECIASEQTFTYKNTVDDLLDDKYPKGYLNHYIAMFASQFDKPVIDNFMVYTDLYIQMEGKKEFEALRTELKRIKANNDFPLYLKFANNYPIANFGKKQLDDMVRVIEGWK